MHKNEKIAFWIMTLFLVFLAFILIFINLNPFLAENDQKTISCETIITGNTELGTNDSDLWRIRTGYVSAKENRVVVGTIAFDKTFIVSIPDFVDSNTKIVLELLQNDSGVWVSQKSLEIESTGCGAQLNDVSL